MTQKLYTRLGAGPRSTTPGHSKSSELVEYNQVLKHMLHHIIRSDHKKWDKDIPYLLFAYRKIPNSTPFKLMYGREARGMLAVPKSTWSVEMPLPITIGKGAIENLEDRKRNLEKVVK